ncbi:hypothetical protein BJ878DRAFT_510455 [Calycina marina]|uniref:Nudix hydrolase domain-containing protein n=1 Tax=Calycina marina TaxID=1763456 RepID=A0A9P7Z0U1_9HELO|nr:hypothetical protein BJ878DRAFT_510455 [Calycina marina]
MLLEDWLDDLCVRFIINLPTDDLCETERLMFHIEEASWYYEDWIRPQDAALPSLSLRNFCTRIFAHCTLLQGYGPEAAQGAYEQFMEYKTQVPVRGVIMMNHSMDQVLLVKGWKKGSNWSFPRGKINKDEDDLICAIRETYEETGYDIQAAGHVPANREVKSISAPKAEQDMTLFVFRNIPMDTHFEPRTRKEISKIEWWPLADLPGFKKLKGPQNAEPAIKANKFYMVAPFLKPLRKWAAEQLKSDLKGLSSHYLTTGISHDELMTEEEMGADSAQENIPPAPSRIDAMQNSTAILKNIVNEQGTTGGLQSNPTKSLETKDSGSALLALLQGSSPNPLGGASSALPHTPLDNVSTKAPVPRTPQHHHPRPVHISSLPAPPSFNIQHDHDAVSYQIPNQPNPLHNVRPNYQHNNTHQNPHSQYHIRSQHAYQSQHIIHPQPLPPNVQRAVFNSGRVYSTMVPPATQPFVQQQTHTVSIAVPNPQFPGLHAPMVPQVRKQTPSKLTSHSLALLNAFKTRDSASGANSGSLTVSHTGEPKLPHQNHDPQELLAGVSQNPPVDLLSLFKASDTPTQAHNTAPPPKKAPSDGHKSTLLGLFKSPSTQHAPLARHTATALPTSHTPSAVELSAVDTLSTNAAPIAAANAATASKNAQEHAIPEMNPETTLPFRATAILARPTPAEPARPPKNIPAPKARHNGMARKKQPGSHKLQSKLAPAPLFQPQILKRPQPDQVPLELGYSSSSPLYQPVSQPETAKTTGPSASPLSYGQVPTSSSQNTDLLALLENIPGVTQSASRSSMLEGKAQVSEPQKNMLSLFGKPPAAQQPPVASPVTIAPPQNLNQYRRQELLSSFGKPSDLSASPRATIAPSSPAADHKQNLLGMFNQVPSAGVSRVSTLEAVSRQSTLDPLSREPGTEAVSPLQTSTRSRMGSLAIDANGGRPGQSIMSPADKDFLLNYLSSVAEKSHR